LRPTIERFTNTIQRARAARHAAPANVKADTMTREYRPCCGRRVTFCPHGFRWVKQNRIGIINRAARRHPPPDLLLALGKAAGRTVTVAEARAGLRKQRRAA